MKRIGAVDNIGFIYSGFVCNTLYSHRIIWNSREEGWSDLQDRFVESVFRAYFKD